MTGTYEFVTLDAGVVLRELLTMRPGLRIPFSFAPYPYHGTHPSAATTAN